MRRDKELEFELKRLRKRIRVLELELAKERLKYSTLKEEKSDGTLQ